MEMAAQRAVELTTQPPAISVQAVASGPKTQNTSKHLLHCSLFDYHRGRLSTMLKETQFDKLTGLKIVSNTFS